VLYDASDRDQAASDRDLAGLARDRAATTRDLAMAQRDADGARDGPRAVTGAEIVMRAAGQRKRATQDRARAAEHRVQAATDREAAANDREQGARDRLQARADREALGRALAIMEIDPLTGARTSPAGLADLARELDRSRRTGGTLVVAYVEAVGLPRADDEGHAAADRLLKRVVALITEHLRSYDLIVRLGGDALLTAMSNMAIPEARERFSTIAGVLASTREAGALRTGFAQLAAEESAAELIARAESELISSRHG
jgi:GGDEF domain-containing protein